MTKQHDISSCTGVQSQLVQGQQTSNIHPPQQRPPSLNRDSPGQRPLNRDPPTEIPPELVSGRCASYWNAFLFVLFFQQKKNQEIDIHVERRICYIFFFETTFLSFQAFVATASCYIEVFKIGRDGHEKTSKFPTVALAKQIVYDETGKFS